VDVLEAGQIAADRDQVQVDVVVDVVAGDGLPAGIDDPELHGGGRPGGERPLGEVEGVAPVRHRQPGRQVGRGGLVAAVLVPGGRLAAHGVLVGLRVGHRPDRADDGADAQGGAEGGGQPEAEAGELERRVHVSRPPRSRPPRRRRGRRSRRRGRRW
jgi:hypothetical protein